MMNRIFRFERNIRKNDFVLAYLKDITQKFNCVNDREFGEFAPNTLQLIGYDSQYGYDGKIEFIYERWTFQSVESDRVTVMCDDGSYATVLLYASTDFNKFPCRPEELIEVTEPIPIEDDGDDFPRPLIYAVVTLFIMAIIGIYLYLEQVASR